MAPYLGRETQPALILLHAASPAAPSGSRAPRPNFTSFCPLSEYKVMKSFETCNLQYLLRLRPLALPRVGVGLGAVGGGGAIPNHVSNIATLCFPR